MNSNNRFIARIQSFVFAVLFIAVIGLLGWVLDRHRIEIDLTWGQRNSLTEASVNVITRMDGPLTITAFVRDSSKVVRDGVEDLLERYRRHKPDIDIKFINPDLVPQVVREHGITVDGELLVQYNNRQETLKGTSEKSLTQLLARLAGDETSYIVFIEGHGERNPLGKANHDLGEFGQRLSSQGFRIQQLNLAKTLSIPDNTRILVIASPQTGFLAGEIQLIEQYVESGGNLLWLTEPGKPDDLQGLAALFDLKRLPGMVVDATTQLLGISDPTFALAVEYPRHKITERLHSQTLFPMATGLISAEQTDWLATPILNTLARSWTEIGDIEGNIRFDPDTEEQAGPITIGMALERTLPDTTQADAETETSGAQRVIVVGDGDFLSNTYLGNGQNLDLGIALFQWLSHNDRFIDIGIVSAPDTQLEVSQPGAIALLLIFLILAPLGLLAFGITIWLKRRNS